MSEPFDEYRWEELLDIIKNPVDMKDDGVFPLASIRRRNGGFFHRETKLGKDILTKTLSKAVPGTFAISRMQVVHGACSYVPECLSDSFLSASYTQFQAKSPPKIDTKYLHYYSHTNDSYNAFLMSSHGVHIEKLTFDIKDWLKRRVKLPPLPEQKKIVSILTSVDEVIKNIQKQIDKLQDLKKATMNELLTKGIGHTEFKDSKLGRIPKSWEVETLNECCEILDSQRIPLNAEERAKRKGDYPYYGANGVQGYIDDYIFEGDAILLAEDGGNFDQYAERPIAQWVTGRFWVNNHAHILRAKSGLTDKWVYYSLVHKNILKYINGGTRAKLNQYDLKEIAILLSPLPEQKKIASILTSMDKTIEEKQLKLSQTQSLKKSLMQDLLTGKVRVNVN